MLEFKEFKNGNLHLHVSNHEEEKVTYLYICENMDMYPVSEEYCISNYATAIILCYNGGYRYYELNSNHLKKLQRGYTVVLYPLEFEEIKDYPLIDETI